MNVPFELRVTLRLLRAVWQVFTGTIPPDDQWAKAAQEAYSIQSDPNLFKYLGWTSRYLELFTEIRKTRNLISRLTTPSRVYMSAWDEMVASSVRIVGNGVNQDLQTTWSYIKLTLSMPHS